MRKSKVILAAIFGWSILFAPIIFAQNNSYQFVSPEENSNMNTNTGENINNFDSEQPQMIDEAAPIEDGKQIVNIGPIQVKLDIPPAVETTEVFEFMSQGQRPGIRISIPKADANDVTKSWKKYLKNFGAKPKMYGSEFLSKEAYIDGLSENTLDIYSTIQPYPEGTLLKVFMDMGKESGYLSSPSNAEQYDIALALLKDFAITESFKAIDEELEQEEKLLYQMDRERQKLQTEYEQLIKDIENYKQAIQKAETDIEQNSLIQEDRNKLTHKQIQKVEQLKYDLHSIRSQQ